MRVVEGEESHDSVEGVSLPMTSSLGAIEAEISTPSIGTGAVELVATDSTMLTSVLALLVADLALPFPFFRQNLSKSL